MIICGVVQLVCGSFGLGFLRSWVSAYLPRSRCSISVVVGSVLFVFNTFHSEGEAGTAFLCMEEDSLLSQFGLQNLGSLFKNIVFCSRWG